MNRTTTDDQLNKPFLQAITVGFSFIILETPIQLNEISVFQNLLSEGNPD